MADEGTARSYESLAPGTLLADRYRTLATLGHGGSATVYAAHDVRRDAEVALKLLARDADAAQRALFQREYHTLAQITHPGVIRVFEYDSAPEGLLYTMERLDGADLSQLAPMPIARACRVLCEVASALAIVHSRRLLHRDVSHRNVRVTADGHAKLIDFGAMSPVGFAGDLIGTPPFLAPEIANRERIDQRSDLYALGALAYWLLNGRHLYPAKTVRQLRKLWQSAPAPSFAPDTPPALQQLIAALLQRDARLRPGSAAEVIDRLSALAGISADQSPSVARAYLDHPKLIGRGAELGSVRGLLDRAGTGQASAMLVLGAQGTGKSRVLEELVMHARFAGLSVLQVSAHAAERKSNGLLMLLFAELQRELPNVFAAVSALRTPSVPPAGAATSVTGPELQARAQAEWLTLFGAAATRERLLLVVDDAHLADDESLITLGALAALAPRGPSILLSARDRSHEGVRRFSARAEKLVKLRALSADETAQLVDSLFSGSPVGTRMATFMHEHTRGNPLQCISLARHLVERGLVRYAGGAWLLPHDPPSDLPRGLSEAARARIAALAPEPRALAELLAVYGKPMPLELCLELSGASDERRSAAAFAALSELVRTELVEVRGNLYELAHESLGAAVLRELSEARCYELHTQIGARALAAGFADVSAELEAGAHLLRGREPLRGLPLVEHAAASDEALSEIGPDVVVALELALRVCEAGDQPRARALRLRARLAMCAYLYDRQLIRYAEPLLDRLDQDSGLSRWSATTGAADQRLMQVIGAAQALHDATPVEQQGLPPIEALLTLGQIMGTTLAVAILAYDTPTIDRLAQRVAPFAAFGREHGLAMLYDLVTLIHDVTRGRLHAAYVRREALFAGLRDPRAYVGVALEHRAAILATQLHARGMLLASRNVRLASESADQIEALGLRTYAGAALQVRWLVQLHRGDLEGAKALGAQLDAVAAQAGPGRQTEIWAIQYLVMAHAAYGDVLALRQDCERLVALVAEHPGYRALLYVALAAYYRERGQLARALVSTRRSLRDATGPQAWVAVAQALETYVAMQRWNDALTLAQTWLGAPVSEALLASDELRSMPEMISPLVLALAHTGRADEALRALDSALADAAHSAAPLLLVGRLHETRARLAMARGDAPAFASEAERVAVLYSSVSHPLLLLRHLRLLDEGARAGVCAAPEPGARAADVSTATVQERRTPGSRGSSTTGSDRRASRRR